MKIYVCFDASCKGMKTSLSLPTMVSHFFEAVLMSCRGIIVAAWTNRSRTQMAEGILRHITGGLVFVSSGGTIATGFVHPLAVRAMSEIGVCIKEQSVSTLASLAPQAATYDVYIGIDAPRSAVPYVERSDGEEERPQLKHWTVVEDASDTMQKFKLWSPRDPQIMCELSQRKFQDNIYEGEPLFPVLKSNGLRLKSRVRHEHWEIEELSKRLPLESEAEQLVRFRHARDALVQRASDLVASLEELYGEQLLVRKIVCGLDRTAAPIVK